MHQESSVIFGIDWLGGCCFAPPACAAALLGESGGLALHPSVMHECQFLFQHVTRASYPRSFHKGEEDVKAHVYSLLTPSGEPCERTKRRRGHCVGFLALPLLFVCF